MAGKRAHLPDQCRPTVVVWMELCAHPRSAVDLRKVCPRLNELQLERMRRVSRRREHCEWGAMRALQRCVCVCVCLCLSVISLSERRESATGTRLSIVWKMNIETVSNIQNTCIKKSIFLIALLTTNSVVHLKYSNGQQWHASKTLFTRKLLVYISILLLVTVKQHSNQSQHTCCRWNTKTNWGASYSISLVCHLVWCFNDFEMFGFAKFVLFAMYVGICSVLCFALRLADIRLVCQALSLSISTQSLSSAAATSSLAYSLWSGTVCVCVCVCVYTYT